MIILRVNVYGLGDKSRKCASAFIGLYNVFGGSEVTDLVSDMRKDQRKARQ